jgi:hypothetical protein
MVTKILMTYNDTPITALHKTVRVTIPNEWLTLKTKVLLKYYVKLYNGIYANKLILDDVHLANAADDDSPVEYKPIPSEELISVHILDRTKVFVRHGHGIAFSPMKPATATGAMVLLERVSSYASDTQKPKHIKSFDDEDDVIIHSPGASQLNTVPEEDSIAELPRKNTQAESRHDVEDLSITRTKTVESMVSTSGIDVQDTKKVGPTESIDTSNGTGSIDTALSVKSESTANVQPTSPTHSFLSYSKMSITGPASPRSPKVQGNTGTSSLNSIGSSSKTTTSSITSPTPLERSRRTIQGGASSNDSASRIEDVPTSGMTDAEDAAIIRFRSILDWLGVHHSLYEGVVRSLESEVLDLKTDDEKHELIKTKLGALLEASYLNASRKATGAMKTPSSPGAASASVRSEVSAE